VRWVRIFLPARRLYNADHLTSARRLLGAAMLRMDPTLSPASALRRGHISEGRFPPQEGDVPEGRTDPVFITVAIFVLRDRVPLRPCGPPPPAEEGILSSQSHMRKPHPCEGGKSLERLSI
jgi:hypothetical protein